MGSDTKSEILTATREALIEHGYTQLSMAKIGDKFDGSQSLIHYHFDSKDQLLAALIREERKERAARFDELPSAPEDRLEHLLDIQIRQFSAWADSDPMAGRLIELYAAAPMSEPIQNELRKLNATFRQAFIETIAAGVDDGTFKQVDPDAVGRLLMAGHDSVAFRWLAGAEEEAAAIMAALEEFVLAEVNP